MQLTDLFIAGVDGLPAQARVRLVPGPNGVYPAPLELAQLLDALFYSAGYDPASPFAGREVRAGCVLFDDTNTAFRLMRELGRGTAQLSRAQDGTYMPVTDNAAEAVQMLRGQLHMPSREAFSALFYVGPDDLPSRAHKPAAAPAVNVAPAAVPAAQLQTELDMLRVKAVSFTSLREKEFALDGFQKKRFALDDIAKKRAVISDRLAQADVALAQTQALDNLPAGFADLVGNFDNTRAKFTDERNKLLEEIRGMEERGEPPAPVPLLKNALFLGGVLGGAVLLGGATMLDGDLRLLGLVDIAPFGLAAVQALSFIDALEESERYKGRAHRLSDRLKKIEAKFERDTQTVREAMKRMEVESPDALLAQVQARNARKHDRDRSKAALDAFDAGDGQVLLGGDAAALDAEIARLEDELAATSAGNDAADVQRRITEIEMLLARGEAPQPAVTMEVAAPAPEPLPFLKLLQALSEISGQGVDVLAGTLAAKTSGMAQKALGLAGTLTLDEQGHAAWQGRAWSTLAAPLQDNVFLTAHIAAFEMVAASVRFPLFLIGLDALPHVLPYAQALPLLEGVGHQAQVVMVAHDQASLLGCPSVVTFV